jgi:hypothetical protein
MGEYFQTISLPNTNLIKYCMDKYQHFVLHTCSAFPTPFRTVRSVFVHWTPDCRGMRRRLSNACKCSRVYWWTWSLGCRNNINIGNGRCRKPLTRQLTTWFLTLPMEFKTPSVKMILRTTLAVCCYLFCLISWRLIYGPLERCIAQGRIYHRIQDLRQYFGDMCQFPGGMYIHKWASSGAKLWKQDITKSWYDWHQLRRSAVLGKG